MRRSSQGDETQLPPEVRCVAPHDEEDKDVVPTLELQPFRAETPPLAFRPGGGPRDFGAQSSEVTAVEGFRSPRVPFDVGSLFCGLSSKFKNSSKAILDVSDFVIIEIEIKG